MAPSTRFEPSKIRNKVKREEMAKKGKKAKTQAKLQKRLEQAKLEANDPLAKKKRLAENVPRTLDNTRTFDPSMITAEPQPQASTSSASLSDPPSSGQPPIPEQPTDESAADISTDAFSSYFSQLLDPTVPPKVLITTSPKATKLTYDFCDELTGIFPGAEFIRRTKGKGFEMGRIAGWAAGRGYTNMVVVNEDMKGPNAITVIHLPEGPTSYFKLSSIELSKRIRGHARPTDHYPELVLNGFVTRLGHAVGRMFQTLFPPMPEFQGRQVVTLHNQRDFLFFRRHRYAFRSEEKVSLQEIGPRFALKLRWLKKGIPAVQNLGEAQKPLEFDTMDDEPMAEQTKENDENRELAEGEGEEGQGGEGEKEGDANQVASVAKKVQPPKQDEYLWVWKPELETTRRTFFL